MAVCGTWKYRNVTPNVFHALQQLGKQHGAAIPNAPSGRFSIKAAGLTVGFSYNWDVRSGVLALTCEQKPMLVGCQMIKGVADNIMADSGAKPV